MRTAVQRTVQLSTLYTYNTRINVLLEWATMDIWADKWAQTFDEYPPGYMMCT